jgi:hypothetical protein
MNAARGSPIIASDGIIGISGQKLRKLSFGNRQRSFAKRHIDGFPLAA